MRPGPVLPCWARAPAARLGAAQQLKDSGMWARRSGDREAPQSGHSLSGHRSVTGLPDRMRCVCCPGPSCSSATASLAYSARAETPSTADSRLGAHGPASRATDERSSPVQAVAIVSEKPCLVKHIGSDRRSAIGDLRDRAERSDDSRVGRSPPIGRRSGRFGLRSCGPIGLVAHRVGGLGLSLARCDPLAPRPLCQAVQVACRSTRVVIRTASPA